MKKTLFTIQVDNHIDLITNSSSELFVLKGKTKETIKEMLVAIYPDYRSEYEEIRHISELTIDELRSFMWYSTGANIWPTDNKNDYRLIDGFTFDELYESDGRGPAWNGQIQYQLKNDFIESLGIDEIIHRIDPDKSLYFLYSIDENPNWEMQEKLETIGKRYHLG